MVDQVRVTVAGDRVLLPAALGEAMQFRGRPRLLVDQDIEGAMVSKFSASRLAKRVARRRAVQSVSCSPVPEGWSFERPSWLAEGDYRIVNYEPQYLLTRAHDEDESADRERFWERIDDYHEHQSSEAQDEFSNMFSEWFATEVIAPLEPTRVLELGCGAGRNLKHIRRALPDVDVVGVEINPVAAERARAATRGDIVQRSLYEPLEDLGPVDVAFTAGVLMHVPHSEVDRVIRSMVANSTKAVVHFELHGVAHDFDFHRYPRDYAALYAGLGVEGATYRVLNRRDPLNGGESVGTMALLTSPVAESPDA